MRLTRKILAGAATLFGAAALSGFGGCTPFNAECEFVIEPRLVLMDGGNPVQPAYMARVYAFYGLGKDVEAIQDEWYAASYPDAEAGIITNRDTDEERSFSIVGEQNTGEGEDGFVHLTVTSSPVLLVAVDPLYGQYAWGVFEYGIPMPRLEFYVSFQPWKSVVPYKEGLWNYASEISDAGPEPDDDSDDASAGTAGL
ncbi:MAG: hypothetical protein LBV18_04650 [Alistipes sp.]|jgi:hypothetical protein|nr:hypothetical protein [Alistipes sp.]